MASLGRSTDVAGSPRGEQSLFAAAQAGEAESLGLLLESCRPYVYARALQLTRSREAAEDAVQDSFVIAMMRLQEVRKPAAFRAWLYTVVTNICLEKLRLGRQQAEARLRLERHLYAHHAALLAADYFDFLLYKDLVWRSLAGLGEAIRLAVMLRYFSSHYTYEEISLILGVPVGTVRSRLAAAKTQLLKQLQGQVRHAACDPEAGDLAEDELVTLWSAMWRGEVRRFSRYFTEDLHCTFVFADGSTSSLAGLASWIEEISGDWEAGSAFHPERAFVSGNVSILEGSIENSPETPFRCPPAASAVLLHAGGRIRTMRLYMAPQQTN